MSAIDRATTPRLAALPLTALLLTSCGADGGAVGAVATGHFSARHHFPVILIDWCGESPPARIDLSSEDHRWRLTANEEFSESPVEVDLSAPGEAWDITDDSGAPAYRVVPEGADTEYTLGVTSAKGAQDDRENDIASLRFDTDTLAAEDGVLLGTHESDEGTVISPDDFPPEC